MLILLEKLLHNARFDQRSRKQFKAHVLFRNLIDNTTYVLFRNMDDNIIIMRESGNSTETAAKAKFGLILSKTLQASLQKS